jgi:hypothetical protein
VAALLALWLAGISAERRRRRPVANAGARHLAARLRGGERPALDDRQLPRVTLDLERHA